MPVATTRQLELSLLEIRRRNRRRSRPAEAARTAAAAADVAATPAAAEPSSKKEAAILVPLCTVRGEPSILFTRRSPRLSSHASQISFPGGYYDDELDSDRTGEWKDALIRTALREMREELRYDLDGMGVASHANMFDSRQGSPSDLHPPPFLSILGRTQAVPSMTGSKVAPIVGAINYDLPDRSSPDFDATFPGNPEEVDWIFTVPIRSLIETETSEPLQRWSTSYGDGSKHGKNGKAPLGPMFPIPDGLEEKREGDRIWGLTAIVLRPLLRKAFGPALREVGSGCDADATVGEGVESVAKL
ncbi:hypothetical protein ACHAWF_009134 [Thalassiosira exigua]